jgi:hypothetical protein
MSVRGSEGGESVAEKKSSSRSDVNGDIVAAATLSGRKEKEKDKVWF